MISPAYKIYRPQGSLSQVIDTVWELDLRARDASGFEEFIFSYPYPKIIFSLGSLYELYDFRHQQLYQVRRPTFLGIRTFPLRTIKLQGNHLIGISFKPSGVPLFTTHPAARLMNLVEDAAYIFGADVAILGDKLAELDSFDKQVSAIVAHFHQQLTFDIKLPLVNEIIGKFNKEVRSGAGGIMELQRSMKVSVKTIERYFLEYTGMSPKYFQGMIRCRQALKAIATTKRKDEFFEFGYYDQSHFIREVKTYTGITPGRIMAELKAV
jgi:AraC-like DNA-binding protein